MRMSFRSIRVLAAATVVIVFWHAARGQQSDASSVRSRFIGTWKLVTAWEKLKDGTTRPYKEIGAKGEGYLIYSADGHMCAQLMNPDRPRWGDPPTAEQKIASVDGFVSYCGRFEIDEANHVMVHYPEVAWKPNYVGTKQARPYTFEGGHLVYSGRTPRDGAPEVVQWRIEWEKVR